MAVIQTARPSGVPRPDLQLVSYRPKRAQGVLTTTSTTLLSCPAGGTIIVDSIIMTEKSNAARTFTLREVLSGGADDNTSDMFQATSLAALEAMIISGPIHMTGGDLIKGLASAATAVNYLINYRQEV